MGDAEETTGGADRPFECGGHADDLSPGLQRRECTPLLLIFEDTVTIENYVVIAAGVVALVCGPLIVRNRRKLFNVFADTNRALGGAPGRQVAKGSSPFWVGFVGVGLAVIGFVALLIGIFARS